MNFLRVEAMIRDRLILSELNFLGFISYALYISEIIIQEQSAIILNKREENARL